MGPYVRSGCVSRLLPRTHGPIARPGSRITTPFGLSALGDGSVSENPTVVSEQKPNQPSRCTIDVTRARGAATSYEEAPWTIG